jgi:ABC-type glutathione transport system ATPase component
MTALGFNQNLYFVRKSNAEKQDANSKSVIPLRYFSLHNHSDPDNPSHIDPAKYEIGIVPRDENNIIPFSRLSSGERNVIQLISLLVSAASSEVTFFVDEPEISLHVKWQQILPSLFSSIAKEFKLSLVVATHSPVMVANAGFGNSICYVAQAGTLDLINSSDRHSVETILLQGFQTYTPHNREVHEKCAKLVSNVIGLVNTDKVEAKDAGVKAIDELESITAIIQKTGQQNGDAQARGDLELLEKAIAAIRSVVPTQQAIG